MGRLLNVVHEMTGGFLRRHAGVNKPDQVRDGVIAKNQIHLGLLILEAMDGVELLRQFSGQMAMCVAPEGDAQASAQYLFVGGHPLHAQTLGNAQDLFRNTALGGPNALGTYPENLLMQIQSTLYLLARVLRMAKPILRQRQAGS